MFSTVADKRIASPVIALFVFEYLHVYQFLNMAIELVHFHSNNVCSPQMETNIGYVA